MYLTLDHTAADSTFWKWKNFSRVLQVFPQLSLIIKSAVNRSLKKTEILVFKTILRRHRFQEGNSWKMYQLNCDLVKSEKVEKWKKTWVGCKPKTGGYYSLLFQKLVHYNLLRFIIQNEINIWKLKTQTKFCLFWLFDGLCWKLHWM